MARVVTGRTSTVSDALDALTGTLHDARGLLDGDADAPTVHALLGHPRELLAMVEEEVAAQAAPRSVKVPGATRGA